MTKSKMVPNEKYAVLADDQQIDRTRQALEAHGIHALLAKSEDEARKHLFENIPAGAEVFTATSRTLETLGVPAEIDKRYDSVRVKLATMDNKTQAREMIKLGATPEYTVGSVHAVTEDGAVVIASNTGSQLAGYAASAAHVIWVVGTQKIVPNLDEAMKRIYEYTLPLENERAFQAYGMNSNVSKLLIVHKEITPGRTTLILVKEKLGF
ncbi:MAG: LUD domain-containing protein [Chloroflexi bacterium]|nr:LUD domain-containing protein [Chloroflexota bacterium]